MSKPFVIKEMLSDSITIHTTDNGAQILLDQNAVLDKIAITTNLFSKGILIQNDPSAFLEIRGGNAGLNLANGNLQVTASQMVLQGSGLLEQNMCTVNNGITLDPAAAVYNELSDAVLGGLNVISRVNVVPDALGTTINSLIVHAGNPNPDGRQIWFQNLGTAVGQTLTFGDLAGAGTAGGLILCPSATDFIVQAGGGVSIMFDDSASADGLWLVRAT